MRFILIALYLVIPSMAQAHVCTADAACAILERVAVQHHFASPAVGKGYYRCDDTSPILPGYYVIGLHFNYHAPVGWVGSNLVGWYAVRQQDGRIFEWDVANNDLGLEVPSE